jgi:putative transposase
MRAKRRVKAKLRDDRKLATQPNETWAMDFVHDQLATGKKIRVLTVVDTFSRFSPVLDPKFSYRAEDVVATLERACASIGIRRPSGLIRDQNLSPAIWIFGLMRMALRWTFPGQENRRTTPLSKRSTVAFARNV